MSAIKLTASFRESAKPGPGKQSAYLDTRSSPTRWWSSVRIPLRALAGGVEDQVFAQQAFAERQPDSVRLRRAKGSFTGFFARWVAANLDIYRPYLLDGCLCEARVLDGDRLDALLRPEALIRSPEDGDVLSLAMVEAWMRHWQGRVPDAAPRWRR